MADLTFTDTMLKAISALGVQPTTVRVGDFVRINNARGNEHYNDSIGNGRVVHITPQFSSSLVGFHFENGLSLLLHPMEVEVLQRGEQEGMPVGLEKPMKVKKPTIKPKVALDSVVLSEEKKLEIKAAIAQVENKEKIFTDWGFGEVFEKGTAITLLFYGIPGTGKTLMAQAIAEEMGAELKIYGTGDIQSSEPGGSERTIKKIFTEAVDFFKTNKKPRVILFDECDSLLYDRNKVGVILGAQINALLAEIERHDGIIIFTTNRMGKLDPALERRIAAKIEFPFPTKKEREMIWKRMIPEKAPLHKDVNLKKLSSYPLAGGNIKNAVLNAARMAAFDKSEQITQKHFLTAIEKESIAAQAFSAEAEGGHTGDIGDVHMEDTNKIVVGENNFLRKPRYKTKNLSTEG